MPNPFPGMNPYLEAPQYWRAVHSRLINAIDEALSLSLPPAFVSTIEERVYLTLPNQGFYPDILITGRSVERTFDSGDSGVSTLAADAPFSVTYPDDEIYEPYIEIRVAGAEELVVTIIEVLSPTNKAREAYGRDAYAKKQNKLLQSDTHLLEIDLLRDGVHTVAVSREAVIRQVGDSWHYLLSLHRGGMGNTYAFWPVSLRHSLPRVAIPLTANYPDVILDLQACLQQVYVQGTYDRRIDYRKEPDPLLRSEDAVWADSLLKESGLR